MLQVQLNVFDNNKGGIQLSKEVSAKTVKGLYSKIDRLAERFEIYEVVVVSPSLVDDVYINELGWGGSDRKRERLERERKSAIGQNQIDKFNNRLAKVKGGF